MIAFNSFFCLPGVIGFLPVPGVDGFISFFLARNAAKRGILLVGFFADSVKPVQTKN